MKPTIFLDMDGVLCDFVTSALIANCSELKHDQITEWDMAKILGKTPDEFWQAMNRDSFWFNLEPYDGLVLFYAAMRACGEVYFCTSPAKHYACASDKIAWLRKHLGAEATDGRFFICKDKHLLAGPDRILVDDYDGNIDRWEVAGGIGVLFPRPWNACGPLNMSHEQAQLHVMATVRELAEKARGPKCL